LETKQTGLKKKIPPEQEGKHYHDDVDHGPETCCMDIPFSDSIDHPSLERRKSAEKKGISEQNST